MARASRQLRSDGRAFNQLRPVRFTPDIAPAAAGSVLVEFGRTRVICAASLEEGIPRWLQTQPSAGGWLTAEYSILPYATRPRSARDVGTGRISGRSQEIQRLIGRSLRAVTDLSKLGQQTVWLDCDVLEADGGTRTAAITGAWVALARAVRRWLAEGRLEQDPLRGAVAAVSVGLVNGRACLDLNYEEDSQADVDLNVVVTDRGRFVEIQGTAERMPFTERDLQSLLRLARSGIRRLLRAQRAALES